MVETRADALFPAFDVWSFATCPIRQAPPRSGYFDSLFDPPLPDDPPVFGDSR